MSAAIRLCLICRLARNGPAAIRRRQLLCTLTSPPPDSARVYSDKIRSIVSDISGLTLKETAQLNELLKETLNITDVPAPVMSAVPAGAPSAAAATEESDEKKQEESQMEVTIKLVKFNEASKIKLIKKIKEVMTGFNLVQAKKLVDSVPQVLKENVKKEEAMKIKSELEAEGGEVTLQ